MKPTFCVRDSSPFSGVREISPPRSSFGSARASPINSSRCISSYKSQTDDRFLSPPRSSFSKSPARDVFRTPTVSPMKEKKTPVLLSVLDAPSVYDEIPNKLLDFSSKGILAVALGSSVFIWSNGKVDSLIKEEEENSATFTAVCWIGDHLVISADGIVELWDIEKQDMIQSLHKHSSIFTSLTASRNQVASGSLDGKVFLYDCRSSQTKELNQPRRHIFGVSFSPFEGNKLAVSNDKGDVNILEQRGHQLHYVLDGPVQAMSWVNQDTLLAGSLGQSGEVHVLHTTCDENIAVETGLPVSGIDWNEKWGIVVSHWSDKGECEIFDPVLNKLTGFSRHSGKILSSSMALDGSHYSTIGNDEALCFWHLKENQRSSSPMPSNSQFVTFIR